MSARAQAPRLRTVLGRRNLQCGLSPAASFASIPASTVRARRDRRSAAGASRAGVPAAVELVLGLEARIEPPLALSASAASGRARVPILLARLLVPRETEPVRGHRGSPGRIPRSSAASSVSSSRSRKLPRYFREQPIQRGGSDVANMESPRLGSGQSGRVESLSFFSWAETRRTVPGNAAMARLVSSLAFLGRR